MKNISVCGIDCAKCPFLLDKNVMVVESLHLKGNAFGAVLVIHTTAPLIKDFIIAVSARTFPANSL